MTEEEWRGRMRFTGEVTMRVPDGEAALTGLEVEAEGGLRAPEGRVTVTLSGPLREVRKLAGLSEGIAALLGHVAEEDEGRTAAVTLVAPPDIVARLRAAGESFTEEPDIHAFLRNEAYLLVLFAVHEYVPEKVSVVTATWTSSG